MKIFSSEAFFGHELPGHAECPGRLAPLLRAVAPVKRSPMICKGQWLHDSLAGRSADVFFANFIRSSHEPIILGRIVERLEQGGQIDADTYVRPDSLSVALEAIACSFAAADGMLGDSAGRGDRSAAMALVRPPGHHATKDRSMGFCLFNTIAVVAKRLQKERGIGRILIVDFDVHHGNGSQDIFYDDDSVFFYSLHRSPFYPGTGAADETGTGRGLGYTLNAPLAADTAPELFLDTLRKGVESAAEKIRPEVILVSAGFDAHRDDPVGGLNLSSEHYTAVAQVISEVAQTACQGRVLSLLEGGYNPERLAESVAAYASGFASASGFAGTGR